MKKISIIEKHKQPIRANGNHSTKKQIILQGVSFSYTQYEVLSMMVTIAFFLGIVLMSLVAWIITL